MLLLFLSDTYENQYKDTSAKIILIASVAVQVTYLSHSSK